MREGRTGGRIDRLRALKASAALAASAAAMASVALAVGVALSGAGELAGQSSPGIRGPRHGAMAEAPPPARRARIAVREPGAFMAERHVAMLERQLGLEEAQTERLRSVFADHFSAMRAIHQHRGTTDREAHMAQMTALWRGTDSRVAEILTPEQNERYEALRARRGPGAREGRPGGMGMRRGPPTG